MLRGNLQNYASQFEGPGAWDCHHGLAARTKKVVSKLGRRFDYVVPPHANRSSRCAASRRSAALAML